MVGNSNIDKLTEPFFQENSFLPPIWTKGPTKGPKTLKNFVMLVFLGNNL